MELSILQLIAVYAIPVVLAITLHEAAHAFVASRLGDRTAQALGRVTINPFKHVDPVGTLLVPGLILLASKALGGGLLFGWAKPVPVIASNLRSPRRDMGLVAAAGPGANLLMALGWGLAIKAMVVTGVGDEFFVRMAYAGILVNIALAVLNLMPVPPLDGGRILTSLLPLRLAIPYSRLEPYGIFILLALLATGLLGNVIGPLVDLGVGVLASILSL
ncbi:site-2 protease family protein [Zeimonas arvi]|uniref:Site-2 protease family protein n=1 Tax=Zeimonas arvi TaxID=2498847 RepID=A0A5C8NN60_9BURK|nr:site-2 protease family protein [Zeimonas arvi]TXL62638.1 site-2 protease family protein [Zeimonas arvi]